MPADPKGICSYCNMYVGRDKVKACSQCRLVFNYPEMHQAHLLQLYQLGTILLQGMPSGRVEDP